MGLVLHSRWCDEDVDPGQERSDGPLPQQLHLHLYEEVFGLTDFPLKIDGTCEAVQLAGAEVALFISLSDADRNIVTRVDGGWSDTEDLSRNDDVGLEAELVVSDPHRRILTIHGVSGTCDPLTPPKKRPEEKYLINKNKKKKIRNEKNVKKKCKKRRSKLHSKKYLGLIFKVYVF